MPNQLKDGSLRVSYVEEIEVHKAMKILAATQGVTISALTRKATEQFLKREDPEGVLRNSAKKLAKKQGATADERLEENTDPEIIELARHLHKQFKK
jgi:hypothetical protein